MKIMVTGGRGFIGQHACEALHRRGHELVVLDLRPVPQFSPQQDIRHVQADVRDRNELNAAMAGCEAVLHLAAAHHDYGLTEATFESVNVEGAEVLSDVMKANAVDSLCFYSSVAVYGTSSGYADEDTVPAPESPYGRTKLRAEGVFSRWASEAGGRCVIIRPAVVFGEGHFANMFTLIRQIDRGAYVQIGSGTNYKSVCYVKNIVSATLSAWLDKAPGKGNMDLYNYADSPDLTSAEIAEHIRVSVQRRRSPIKIPYRLAKILVLPVDMFAQATGKHMPISGARIRKFAVSETRFRADRIRQTGFAPEFSILQGLDRMIAWYRSESKGGTSFKDASLLPPERFSA